MSPNLPTRPARLVYVALAMLALLIIASPGQAAGPRPQQPLQPGQGAASATINADATQASTGRAAQNRPEANCPPDGQCFADVLSGNPFYDFINRIYQQDLVTGYACGGAGEPCDPNNRPYYRPVNNVTRQQMAKFIDNARRLPEIHLDVASALAPIYSRNTGGPAIEAHTTNTNGVYAQSDSGYGVYGQSGSGLGVYGISDSSTGVYGHSNSGTGAIGQSDGGYGVYGISSTGDAVHAESDTGDAVYAESDTGFALNGYSHGADGVSGVSGSYIGVAGESGSFVGVYGHTAGTALSAHGVDGLADAPALAGFFSQDVIVTGNCCASGAGSFRIDHPLDPANKYLYQSAVESSDMKSIYDGIAVLDDHGEAWVQLPDWFESLNMDFRYQLTPIGAPGHDLYIAHEIENNRFQIAGGTPGLKVSWQVTGIRHDPYANANRVPVEEDKPAEQLGKYQHPAAWGQPVSSGIDYQERQMMQQPTQSKR